MNIVQRLGVDIGGVIIDRINDGTDTSFFGSGYLRTTAVPGAFDALRQLVAERFGDEVYLVSKCGTNIRKKTEQWLAHHRFFERTGILQNHAEFCPTRPGKAAICTRLKITHFIDDRLEVLGYLPMVGERYLFRPNPDEVRKFSQHLAGVRRVDAWSEVLLELLK